MNDRDKTIKELTDEIAELRQEVNGHRLTEQRLRVADKALHYRILFEDLIMRISTEFISLPTEKIPDGIDRALKAIGGFCGVDRSYLLQLSDGKKEFILAKEWHSEGIDPPDQPFGIHPLNTYEWIAPAIHKGETIYISRLAELPAEAAAEREDLERNGVRSLLLVPIFYAGRMIGAAGFDAIRTERMWPEEIISLLRIIGEVFANALMRVRSEEALEEKDSSFRKFIESAKDAILISNDDWVIRNVNAAACHHYGYSRKELIGKKLTDLAHPDSRKKLKKLLQSLKRAVPFSASSVDRRRDGTPLDVELWGSPYVADGKLHSLMLIRDVSRDRKTEKALRFMRFAVDHAADSIYWIGENGNLIYANNAACRELGYSRKEIFELGVRDVSRAFSRKQWRETWDKIRNDGSLTSESIHVRKDGSSFPVEVSANFVQIEGEAFCCAFARNITERKESEGTQRRLNSLLDSIIENIPAMITLQEAGKLRYLRFNRASEELLGVSRDEVIGKTDFDLHPTDKALSLTSRDRDVLKGGQLVDIETERIETEQLGVRILHTKKIPISDESGTNKYLLGISEDVTKSRQVKEELQQYQNHLEDLVKQRAESLQKTNDELQNEITERREAQVEIRELNETLERRVRDRTAELEKALDDLKRLDEMKDAFVSSVSHELRTPLTSIRSYSEVLLEYEDEAPETRREFLGIIKLESERLSRLIEDVLDISRIQSDGMIWNDEEVCLNDLIDYVAHVLQNQATLKNIRLHLDVTPGLPRVFADKDRIEQVFQNLISNAIKFSRKGGAIRICASSHSDRRGGEEFHWVRGSVSDEGSGIDEKDFEIIFERFQQATHDSLVNKPKGTGLGLPICKDIITHYEGSIWVESEKDVGSTFFFTLPAINPATVIKARRQNSHHTSTGRTDSPIQL